MDYCIVCGKYVPEGMDICPTCDRELSDDLTEAFAHVGEATQQPRQRLLKRSLREIFIKFIGVVK